MQEFDAWRLDEVIPIQQVDFDPIKHEYCMDHSIDGCSGSTENRMGKLTKRQMIVKRVLAAMAARAGERFSLADLCRIAQVSERTLCYAFKEHCNLSPARFLKIHRLRGAHRDLSRAGRKQSTISDVANKWGFWHMGQFAKDYRGFFGELPSETQAIKRRRGMKRDKGSDPNA